MLVPLCRRGHHLQPVRAQLSEGARSRARQRPLRVQRRGLRAGRSALACADRAGRPGRGAPRSPRPPPANGPPLRHHAIVRWIGRLVCPLQALAKTVATEVHSHAARCRWSPCDTILDQPHCNARPRSDARTDRFGVVVTREAPYNRRLVHQGPVQAAPLPCHSPARRRTERCHSGRAACLSAHATRRTHAAILRCTPIPHRAPAVRPDPSRTSFSAHLTRPIAAVNFFPSLATQKLGRRPR